ncbi:MAG: mechanosensitive ion channel family protein [archaeon]
MLEGYIENSYLRAGIIFLIVFLVVRVWMFGMAKILPFFTSKTKTTLDDEIVKNTSTPFTIFALLAGLRFALTEIPVKENLSPAINNTIISLMIITGAVFAYYIVDALVTIGYTDFRIKVRGKVNESLIQFFHSILKIIFIFIAFLVILSSWGVEIGPLLAGLGVAGIAVAFALQSTLSNVFGGISMILDRSINVRDLVDLEDGTRGHILKINLRSTKIKTLDDELVIVPNGKLSESNIKNLALPSPITRVVVSFGVAYGSDVEKVKKLVLKELKDVVGLVEGKEIKVRFLEMADSSLNFKAYFYVDTFDNILDAIDDANSRIYDALNKAGISIPFPQMDVHLKK